MTKRPAAIKDSWKRQFIFVACQPNSQEVCKQELLTRHPTLRFSFSRPGFMTFKVTDVDQWPLGFDLKSSFARTYGWCLGQVGTDDNRSATKLLSDAVAAPLSTIHLHAWHHDAMPENYPDDPENRLWTSDDPVAGQIQSLDCKTGEAAAERWVIDAVKTRPGEWWLGVHRADQIFQRWPAGIPALKRPEEMISRTYLKTSEALLWARLPIATSDVCVEIGGAPGGSCQRLLELGVKVIAVDPADMDPRIVSHPNLTHLKKRGRDVRHREIQNARWLLADSNVAPNHTLDTIESIVAGKKTHMRGLLITLKLIEWDMARRIPEYLDRVRGWGFQWVKSRQLAYGAQEVCLVALRHRSKRRFTRSRSTADPDRTGSSHS